MEPFSKVIDESNRAGAEFLFTELATGRTFLQLAEASQVEETRVRNRQNACVAYKTVQRYAGNLVLAPEQRERLETLMAEFKQLLQQAGVDLEAK